MGKKKKQKRLVFQGLKFIMVVVFLLAVMGLVAGQGLAAVIDIGADGIFVEAGIDKATSLELRVAGPGGFHDVRQSATGTLEWNLPTSLADGEYRYEVYMLVGDEPEKGEDVKDNRELQDVNGRFVVEGGAISPEAAAPPAAGSPDEQSSLHPAFSLLLRVAETMLDFIVPQAHAADVIINDDSPLIYWEENDSGTSGYDWYTRGWDGEYSIYDPKGSRTPLTLITNTPFELQLNLGSFQVYNNDAAGESIFLDDDCGVDVLRADSVGDIELADGAVFIEKSTNHVGIGTVTPTENLHIVDGTPGILLDDLGSVTISIVQNGGEVTFTRSGESTNPNGTILTLEDALDTTLYPGLGIWEGNPEAPLHVGSHDNMSGKIVVENPTTPTAAGDITMFSLQNSGTKTVRFEISAGGDGDTWTFDNEALYNTGDGINSGRFRITKRGTGVAEFVVDGFGNGTFYAKSYAVDHVNTSARDAKTDFKELNEGDILAKIMRLPVSQWRYKQEGPEARHIGPVAEDFQAVFGLGDGKHISTVDSGGVALAAIKAIKAEKDAEIAALKEDNRVLLERLNALEELVLGRQKVTQLMQ